MRFLLCVFLGVTYLSLNSCSHDEERKQVQLLPSQSGFAYELREEPEAPAGIVMAVSAVADSNQRLKVNILWENQSEDTLLINFAEALLWNESGRRVGPREHNLESTRLLPSAKDTVCLTYEPVSNLQLYRQTGMRGPLTSSYMMPMRFIQKGRGGPYFKDTLKFNLPPSRYQDFLSLSNATEQVSLYKIHVSRQQEAILEKHLATFFKEKLQTGTVHLTEEEVFVAGVNTRVGVYKKDDSLFMKLHIVNHSSSILDIKPQELKLEGRSIQAAERKYEKVILKRGERYSFNQSYYQQKEDSLWLNLKGIGLYKSGEYLVAADLLLVPRNSIE
jgi:hypothetical protein